METIEVTITKDGNTLYKLHIAKPVPEFGASSVTYTLSNTKKSLLSDTVLVAPDQGVLSTIRAILARMPL